MIRALHGRLCVIDYNKKQLPKRRENTNSANVAPNREGGGRRKIDIICFINTIENEQIKEIVNAYF